MSKSTHSPLVHFVSKLNAVKSLFICIGVAALSFIILLLSGIEVLTRILFTWDVFCLSMLAVIWLTFFHTDCIDIQKEAKEQDESRVTIFIIVLASVLLSLLSIFILINQRNEAMVRKDMHVPVSIVGVVLSWFLLHTIFTLRYAHIFYSNNKNKPAVHAGGLDFPEITEPDYLDFAYFSFIIGMTFQVSDVRVTSRSIRRLVLLHSILSFIFNTSIVALLINIIAGLNK